MEQLNIIMNEDGKFNLTGANAGYIEEHCAKVLKIELNDFFKSLVLSYYTISFEVCGFGKKVITENIYREDGVIEGQAYYNNGFLYCPLFDYITAAPYVNIQIDGYETNPDGDIVSIYKSSIFTLKFSPSITGESHYPVVVRTDLKLTEKIHDAIENKFKTYKVSENEISDNSVSTDKLKDNSVTNIKLCDNSVLERNIKDDSVSSSKIKNNSIKNEHILNSEISLSKLSSSAIEDFLMIVRNDDMIKNKANWEAIYNSVKDVVRTLFEDFSEETIDVIESFFIECDGNVLNEDAYAYCYYAWYIFSAISGLVYESYVDAQLENGFVSIDEMTALDNRVTMLDNKFVWNTNFDSFVVSINTSIANIYSEILNTKLQMATKEDLNNIIDEINTAIGEVAGGNS